MRSISIQVYGRVQGVWFRGSTQRKARELGVRGFVCNREDGSVYIEAHGSEASIEALIKWCTSGPPHAQVNDIKVHSIDPDSTSEFVIKRNT